MKKTLFILTVTAALLGGNTYANTGFEGGTWLGGVGADVVALEGETLQIFDDPDSDYVQLHDVYGYYGLERGRGSVIIEGGIVENAYGGYSYENAFYHKVKITGGIVRQNVYGGYASKEMCNADGNTVIVSGGSVGGIIYGGYKGGQEYTSACSNKVYITDLSASCSPDVIGGWTTATDEASASSNQVHLVGDGAQIRIDNELYQGHAVTLGKVIGGQADGYVNGNSIDIYGSGISAKSLTGMQILNFHLVDGLATAEAPMVALTETGVGLNLASFTLGIIADDVTDWGALDGCSITLVETQLAIQGYGDNPYKVVDVSMTGQSASKGLLTLGNEGKELHLKVLRPGTEVLAPGESRQAGSATLTALKGNEPGLLGNLTLGNETILGKGRDSSRADGLMIQSTANLTIEGMTITANNEIHVGDNTLTLKDVTISGDWTVAAGSRLKLMENSAITGSITLEEGVTMDLGGSTLSSNVSLGWNTTIGTGTINGEISFTVPNQQVTLCGNLGGTGNIFIGVVNISTSYPIGIDIPLPVYTSALDMGGYTLSKGLQLVGDTTVSNGKLVLAHDMNRTLMQKEHTVTIGANATVDLSGHTFMHHLVIEENTAIGNGTIGSKVTVNADRHVRFFGETHINSNDTIDKEYLLAYYGRIETGNTSIEALKKETPGLLKELSVSDGLIAGTGRAASLAYGLYIESEADLMIENMTITANNEIHVGDNTITLKDVTIKISDDVCSLVNGIFTIDLKSLINCDLVMENVMLDASELTLPQDFDFAKDAVAFDFGDDVDIKQATGLDVRVGNYWTPIVRTDEQGRVIFTKLVETPEPTTGTLSLLALAAFAARRRKR